MKNSKLTIPSIILSVIMLVTPFVYSAKKLTAEQAGTIPPAKGQLAFIRNGDIWSMNVDGTDQMKISAASNADGRLSWSPDNKQIIFTRAGKVDLRKPDFLGGQHKVYDLFLAYVDSALNGNVGYWYMLTDDVGSRDPQWTKDNKIIYYKDMNANFVNAFSPNYQIATMDSDGNNIEILRKDWQNFYNQFLTQPSINKNGDIACVFFEEQRQVGLVIIPSGQIMNVSMDNLKTQAEANKALINPVWSPDGKWIAVINNSMADAGLYLMTPDLKEKYLIANPVGTYLMTMTPCFSPDSKWITFATTDGSIWICDITGNNLQRLTGPGPDKAPAWSK